MIHVHVHTLYEPLLSDTYIDWDAPVRRTGGVSYAPSMHARLHAHGPLQLLAVPAFFLRQAVQQAVQRPDSRPPFSEHWWERDAREP